MANDSVSRSTSKAFRTNSEENCLPLSLGGKLAPALIFNPNAAPVAIAAAAVSRADCLRKSLDTWSAVGHGTADASEVAGALEPMAQELVLLLDELVARLQHPSPVVAG